MIPAGHRLSKTEGKKATCTEPGNAEYWYCSVCKNYFSDEDGNQEIMLADTVIPAIGHQLSKTDSKAATCTEAGNTEYWTCNVCGKYFSDEAGTKETVLADTIIPAIGHQQLPAQKQGIQSIGLATFVESISETVRAGRKYRLQAQ